MNEKINQNKIYNTHFGSIKPKVKEVSMDNFIKDFVKDTIERAERYVAEYGSFTFPEKKFSNPNSKLVVDKFWIEIVQAPKGIENYQKIRGVRLFASRKDSGTPAYVMLASGTKEEILAKMKNENFQNIVSEQTKNLSYNLEDL